MAEKSAALVPQAVIALAQAVSVGIDIIKLVESDDRTIAIAIHISNATKYLLTSEGYFTAWGHLKSPPASITGGSSNTMVARKSKFTTTGSCGVAVWKISDTNKHLVMLWAVPWFTSNMLALGVKKGRVEPGKEIYDEMYDDEESWFRRRKYVKGEPAPPVELKDELGWRIHGPGIDGN